MTNISPTLLAVLLVLCFGAGFGAGWSMISWKWIRSRNPDVPALGATGARVLSPGPGPEEMAEKMDIDQAIMTGARELMDMAKAQGIGLGWDEAYAQAKAAVLGTLPESSVS